MARKADESGVAVVDGSNVAWEERTDDGKPRVANISAMIETLTARKLDPIVLVDASLRHQIDDAEELERLIEEQVVRQSPAGAEADIFVLRLAQEFDAHVVSNDVFESRAEHFPWVEQRRIPFMIVRGHVVLDGPE